MDRRAAELIFNCRHKVGLSRRELARRAGTSPATLAAYESGTKVPAIATLERILRATGYDLAIGVRPLRGPDQPFPDERGIIVADLLRLADALPLRRSERLEYPVPGP